MYRVVLFSAVFVFTCSGREIVFPSAAGIGDSTYQTPIGLTETVDIVTGSQFSGLTTFAHLPYVNCFIETEVPNRSYDIAFLGAPFDTGVTARPGARYGPGGIRLGSRRMSGWSIFNGINPFDDWATVVDCGDAPLTFLDNTVALKQLDLAHKASMARNHTWDPEVLGGGISHYAGVNHGTFLHIAHEEGLISNSSLHVGIRAPMIRRKGDVRNDIRCGFEILTARDLDRFGIDGMVERIKSRVSHNRVYISVDIDVLDPSYAPATGTAEPGGFTSRELLSILDGLSGLPVIGADVVEVAPIYDNPGETTTLAAAEVARSLLTLMIEEPVSP
ncbi:agmatinase 1 [Paecilomyces variotii No. 5]|uniref:Agmatinase 1 n=1 Tax=Byssochlamys spectabilis (strain No. 5 / NBRC 109023) TaxID=1356009 RepID=V5FY62_BYSSN|nr:agmatinase 1 [Paecilomyces variotii No. 5]